MRLSASLQVVLTVISTQLGLNVLTIYHDVIAQSKSPRDGSLRESFQVVRPLGRNNTKAGNFLFSGNISRVPKQKNHSNLMDAMVRGELPVIYPARLPGKENPKLFAQIEHAAWPHPAMRQYGIGPDAVSESDGGSTVVGDWPDIITNFTYIPLLKNAHTALGNAVGDIRQRIKGGSIKVLRKGIGGTITLVGKYLQISPHILTVLRDPIDRFISATCEDIRMKSRTLGCLMFQDLNETISCELQRIVGQEGKEPYFTHHQTPQYAQLYNVMGGLDAPVSVILFEQLSQLMHEMGNGNPKERIRDRSDTSYATTSRRTAQEQVEQQTTKKLRWPDKRLSKFCGGKPEKILSIEHLEILCRIYQVDVDLLRSVGSKVPACDGVI